MRTSIILLFLLTSNIVFTQNNYSPNKEQLMVRNNRANEVITMLHILSETYKMKTAKFGDNIPRELSQYYHQVNLEFEKCYQYNLENEATWIQVRDFYIKLKNYIMSW